MSKWSFDITRCVIILMKNIRQVYDMERKSRTQILKEVRERLSSGNYNEIQKLRSINSYDSIIIVGDKILTEKEVFEFYDKVVEIQQNDELQLRALGHIVENDVFEKLDDTQKQKYLFDVSKLYLKLREEYFSRRN